MRWEDQNRFSPATPARVVQYEGNYCILFCLTRNARKMYVSVLSRALFTYDHVWHVVCV